jgi:uncharacterized repeat protein (TIGR03803 family)
MDSDRRSSFGRVLTTASLVLCFGAVATIATAQGYRLVCPNGGIGPNPLTQDANGNFYGTTTGGGNNLGGTVFKMDPATCTVTVLHHFGGAGDGKWPYDGVTVANDGFLYGTTVSGGSDNYGTVYRLDTDGNNYTFTSMLSPGGICGVNGDSPSASPMQASDGGVYVTMNICGPLGANGSSAGTVVSVSNAPTVTALSYFDPHGNFAQPLAPLVEGTDNMLYGTVYQSWFMTEHEGAVFKMPLGGGDPQLVYAFSGPDGARPEAPLSVASDGSLWGTTSERFDDINGVLGGGTLFKVDKGTLSTVHNFSFAEGSATQDGGAQEGPDNWVYGLTTGQNGYGLDGIVFRSNLAGSFERVAKVEHAEIGRVPYGQLYRAQDGKLYGQSLYQACCSTVGTYFSIDTTKWIDSVTPDSGPAAGGTSVAIDGAGFVAGAQVEFETEAANGEVFVDVQHITAVTPSTLVPGSITTVRVRLPDNTVILKDRAWFANFLDLPENDIFHSYVEWIVRNGITAGCGSGLYCRNNPVTRGQMAVFLEKAMRGPTFVPPFCAHVFPDVPCSHPFAQWIEQLADDGITTGCGGGNFCPNDPVLRQQMAVFIEKAKRGSAFDPPDCTGLFDDVACTPGTGFADWIEQLVADQITGGCSVSPPLYCPTNPVTRGQMAVFLEKAFSQP